jgi:pyruvate dehydrogenase E1 component alpha subunit
VVDIALRARGYGMPGVTVDGMDVMAVREAAMIAVETARAGRGPTLIEAKTYRYYGHNEGDPQVYRTEREIEEWRKVDPIVRLKTKLINENTFTEEASKVMENGVVHEIEEAVKFAEESPLPDAIEYLDDVYVSYP